MKSQVKSRKAKIIIICLISFSAVALSVMAVYVVRGVEAQSTEVYEEKRYAVEVSEIASSSLSSFVTYSALIQTGSTEQVMFATVSEIEAIYVSEGDTVVPGQVLVQLDASNARMQADISYQQMTAAENNRNSAEADRVAAEAEYAAATSDVGDAERIAESAEALDAAIVARDEIQAELTDINEDLSPIMDEISDLELQYSELIALYELFKDNTLPLPDDGTLTEAEQNAQVVVINLLNDIESLNDELARQEADLRKTVVETQLSAANLQVQSAQLEYDRLVGADVLEEEARQAQIDAAGYAFESSNAMYESSKTSYESALNSIADHTYKAKSGGTVLTVLSDVGSVATPLAPILVIGSDEVVAQFGMSAADLQSTKVGDSATVLIGENEYTGYIKSISLLPDETTLTYLTDITIENPPENIMIGEIVTVRIYKGEQLGIWLPLSVILNDGEDYVFVAENDRAARKNIEILDVNDDLVLVSGVSVGDMIITQGMKTVKSGYLVTVVN